MAPQQKHGLGKGLNALFGDMDAAVPANRDEAVSGAGNGVVYVDLDAIKPNAMQPRKNFSDETLRRLAGSIEAHGVIQPVIVKKNGESYELVAGERRWRAARKAGLREVPAVIRDVSSEENALFAIIENVQREDLNPIEEAEAFRKIIDTYKLTQENLSKSVGKSRPYIANTLRLLKLPGKVRELLESGSLSLGHANAIGALKDEKALVDAAQQIAREGLSVRETEKLVARLSDKPAEIKEKPKTRKKSAEIKVVEEELTTLMGTKVTLELTGNGGIIAIHFYSMEELDGLIEDLRGSVK